MEKLTAARLLEVIKQADAEKHPAEQAYIGETLGLREVVLDGKFDLERMAELLSRVLA